MDQKHLLDVQDVAKIFNIQPSWIYGRVHADDLPFPYLKVGTYLRFRKEDIEDFIEEQLRERKKQ